MYFFEWLTRISRGDNELKSPVVNCEFPFVGLDLVDLKKVFDQDVFGQHIAAQTVINALKEHRRKLDDLVAQKSLVLSFHGAMGTGKNLMADMIATNMFMMGKQSVYVYEFDGNTLHEQKVSHFICFSN